MKACDINFRSWISWKSYDKFYSDEFLQQKFDFNETERKKQ